MSMFNRQPYFFSWRGSVAFHDCVGPNGCDGCVNLQNHDNDGLAGIITTLTTLRDRDFSVRYYYLTVTFDIVNYVLNYANLLYSALYIIWYGYVSGHI